MSSVIGRLIFFSFFGFFGNGDTLSEGAMYGTDQSTATYSPYSVFTVRSVHWEESPRTFQHQFRFHKLPFHMLEGILQTSS